MCFHSKQRPYDLLKLRIQYAQHSEVSMMQLVRRSIPKPSSLLGQVACSGQVCPWLPSGNKNNLRMECLSFSREVPLQALKASLCGAVSQGNRLAHRQVFASVAVCLGRLMINLDVLILTTILSISYHTPAVPLPLPFPLSNLSYLVKFAHLSQSRDPVRQLPRLEARGSPIWIAQRSWQT